MIHTPKSDLTVALVHRSWISRHWQLYRVYTHLICTWRYYVKQTERFT